MNPLPHRIFMDISQHTAKRLSQQMHDAMDLVQDPEQRTALATAAAAGMVAMAAATSQKAYAEKFGNASVSDHEAVVGIVVAILKREGVEFEIENARPLSWRRVFRRAHSLMRLYLRTIERVNDARSRRAP